MIEHCTICGREDDGTFRYVTTKFGIELFCGKACFDESGHSLQHS